MSVATAAVTPDERERFIAELEEKMRDAALKLEVKKAAQWRDRVKAPRRPSGARRRRICATGTRNGA
jgi:excinuclease UvrABC helicase subunit UvrB